MITKNENLGRIEDIPTQDASSLSPNITKRTIFGPENGTWESYVMRHFVLPEGNDVPQHTHEWDHLIVSVSGHGCVMVDGTEWDLDSQTWTRVPGGTLHSYRNKGKGDWTFLCIVPPHGDPQAKKFVMRRDRAARKASQDD